EKVRRLYEQIVRAPLWKRALVRAWVAARVSLYITRWDSWAGTYERFRPQPTALRSVPVCVLTLCLSPATGIAVTIPGTPSPGPYPRLIATGVTGGKTTLRPSPAPGPKPTNYMTSVSVSVGPTSSGLNPGIFYDLQGMDYTLLPSGERCFAETAPAQTDFCVVYRGTASMRSYDPDVPTLAGGPNASTLNLSWADGFGLASGPISATLAGASTCTMSYAGRNAAFVVGLAGWPNCTDGGSTTRVLTSGDPRAYVPAPDKGYELTMGPQQASIYQLRSVSGTNGTYKLPRMAVSTQRNIYTGTTGNTGTQSLSTSATSDPLVLQLSSLGCSVAAQPAYALPDVTRTGPAGSPAGPSTVIPITVDCSGSVNSGPAVSVGLLITPAPPTTWAQLGGGDYGLYSPDDPGHYLAFSDNAEPCSAPPSADEQHIIRTGIQYSGDSPGREDTIHEYAQLCSTGATSTTGPKSIKVSMTLTYL
ncbi:hypothetical protein, partial [Citrobacter koseri]|uniref:hypothetical protein n=1 Tax=Citrobacter koseri TaxID=545 RepID=UPI001F3A326C